MIDFVKIGINAPNLANRLRNDEMLRFERHKNKHTATHKNLKITLHESERVEVCGSLHKFWNGAAAHNYNDFGRLDLWDVLHEICDWLQIAPEAAQLHNVEFGVNLVTPFDPTAFLGGLMVYKDEPFCRAAITGKGYYKQAAKSQYVIKTYDKGKQYDRPEHILRFEVKVTKMEYLEGVRTLADLMDVDKLSVLGKLLIKAWSECIVVEPFDGQLLTKPERKIYERATDATTWDSLNNRTKRHRLRANYEAIVDKYLSGGRKKEVAELLRTKWSELLAIPKNCNVLTDFKNAEMQHFDRSNIGSERYILGVITDEAFSPVLSSSFTSFNNDNEGRFCLVTGEPITHQKIGSKFLSEKTLKADGVLLERLEFGRRRNKRKSNQTNEYYAAHNARNDYYNEANNLRRRVLEQLAKPKMMTLFGTYEQVYLSEYQKKVLARFEGTPFEVQI